MPGVGNNLVSVIYVKYDDIDAGNSLKNNILRDELKEYVPIKAITKTFYCSHKYKTVTVQLKQLPTKLGYAITMHNSPGSALGYIEADFGCISKNGKPNAVPINLGAMCTILLCVKNRDTFQLVNFKTEHIKVNTAALQEILTMREEALFSYFSHLFVEISKTKVALPNM